MPKKIILFPFGGNARESLVIIQAINKAHKEWDVLGFVDDDSSVWGRECCGVKVLGDKNILKKHPDSKVLAVPGNPKDYIKRKKIIKSLGIENERFATILHPSVTVAADASVGYNTVLMSNVFISCGSKVGNHCIFLSNTVVSHDSVVGDYCCVGSNVAISGNVIIGKECYVGSGSNIKNNTSIAKRSLIGLGSNVVSNIPECVVAAGNPARIMRSALEKKSIAGNRG